MKLKKIFISRKSINKQAKEERFLFYMSNWFISEICALKSIYFFSMNVTEASPPEVYGRNYRTMFIGCLLGAKLWEGWQMLQKCYFPTKIHPKYEPLYSQETKDSLDFLKNYFNRGKGTIIGKIRKTTFHYPTSQDEKNAFEKYFAPEKEDEGVYYFLGHTYEQSLFSIDQFIVSFKETTKAKDIKNAIKLFHEEIQKVITSFYCFLGEYILLFQKKCDFSQEDMQLKNLAIRKEVEIPFFYKEN